MAGGLSIQVRQIASYPQTFSPAAGDLVLLQQAGLGGPYATVSVASLVANGLAQGPSFGVGVVPPVNAQPNQVFAVNTAIVNDGARYWNAYTSSPGPWSYWQAGVAGADGFDGVVGFDWQIAPPGPAGGPIAPTSWQNLMRLDPAGALSLQHGTLTVARDPASALEVATMGWVGANTVASFNGRKGTVTLSALDIECALGYPVECIATLPQVDAKICAAIQDLLRTYPSVWSWNGRVGDIWLTTDDMNCATLTPGSPALQVPTPPAASNDLSVVNSAWVQQFVSQTAGFATEAWVTQQITQAIAGTVTSFNGRLGVVTLNQVDITSAGGAPITSPNFTGIPSGPTAVVGTSTAQLATTAFVMNTLTALTPGVVSFNGRAGTVTLNATDINNAGGALLASPNFTGTPAAPTAPNGTATSQIATTAFVMAEIAATTAGVVSFNGRSGVVTLQTADITAAGGAPNASPALTGVPTAPTAANGTSSTQLATTAFVMNEINAINAGVLTFNGRSGTVSLTQNDVTAVGGLVNPSAALTGTPTAPTPAPTDNSTNIATTAFVKAALANVTGGATVSNSAPASPTTGMLWFNTSDAQTYVWNGSTWVIAVNPPMGLTQAQADQRYLLLTGGGLSGALSVNGALSVTGAGNSLTVANGLIVSNGANAGLGFQSRTVSGNNWQWSASANLAGLSLNAGSYAFYADTSLQTFIPLRLSIGSITTIGQNTAALVAQTNTQSVMNTYCGGSASGSACLVARTDSVNVSFCIFVSGGGNTVVGSITNQGSSTAFNTTSDDRLKTNQGVLDTSTSGPIVDALSPITFNWTADPAGTAPAYGFSAQATQAVFPQAVTTGAGNPGDQGFMPYGMDMTKLVPLLVAEVKSLRARVAALEAK